MKSLFLFVLSASYFVGGGAGVTLCFAEEPILQLENSWISSKSLKEALFISEKIAGRYVEGHEKIEFFGKKPNVYEYQPFPGSVPSGPLISFGTKVGMLGFSEHGFTIYNFALVETESFSYGLGKLSYAHGSYGMKKGLVVAKGSIASYYRLAYGLKGQWYSPRVEQRVFAKGEIQAVALDSRNQEIAIASKDQLIHYSIEQWPLTTEIPLAFQPVAMAYSAEGRLLISSTEKEVFILEEGEPRFLFLTEQPLKQILPHPGYLKGRDVIYFSPKKGEIVAYDLTQDEVIDRIEVFAQEEFISLELRLAGSSKDLKMLAATSHEIFTFTVQLPENLETIEPKRPLFSYEREFALAHPLAQLLARLPNDLADDMPSDSRDNLEKSKDPIQEDLKNAYFAFRLSTLEILLEQNPDLVTSLLFDGVNRQLRKRRSKSAERRELVLKEKMNLLKEIVFAYHLRNPQNKAFADLKERLETLFQSPNEDKVDEQILKKLTDEMSLHHQTLEEIYDSKERVWVEAIDIVYERILSGK